MGHYRSKQFVHNGEKLWADFIRVAPEVRNFVIQDPALRLPIFTEAEEIMKAIGWSGKGAWQGELGKPKSTSVVAMVRWPGWATLVCECADPTTIPLWEMFEVQVSRAITATRKVPAEVILIRTWTGQSPNNRDTGTESGE